MVSECNTSVWVYGLGKYGLDNLVGDWKDSMYANNPLREDYKK